MPTPNDRQRTAAIRAWLRHVDDLTEAARLSRVSPRTLQRFFSGREIPPPRLLEDLANLATGMQQDALAAQLLAAASRPATPAATTPAPARQPQDHPHA